MDPVPSPATASWRVLEAAPPVPPPAPGPGPGRGAGLPPWLRFLAGGAAVAGAVAAALVVASPPPVAEVALAAGPSGNAAVTASEGPAASPGTILVDVGGAVLRPGLVRLPAGARVGDAIAAAGGYGPRVDAAAADHGLNLAAPLRDGDEVIVPSRDDPVAAMPSAGRAEGTGGTTAGGPVDLNHATAAELDTLPGVGPATAAKIIAAREERLFASLEELVTRGVVGQATLDRFRARATVLP